MTYARSLRIRLHATIWHGVLTLNELDKLWVKQEEEVVVVCA